MKRVEQSAASVRIMVQTLPVKIQDEQKKLP